MTARCREARITSTSRPDDRLGRCVRSCKTACPTRLTRLPALPDYLTTLLELNAALKHDVRGRDWARRQELLQC